MTLQKYRTQPVASSSMPRGIPYIVGNEAAERFSFYGMKTILVIFMTKYLMDASGQAAVLGEAEAREAMHDFVAQVYFFGILGAVISDALLGKYRTIIWGSLIYCAGHGVLALMEPIPGVVLGDPRRWLTAGLFLIAIGSGCIKPCVTAHVGDQFGAMNQGLLSKVFGWFYFSINLGAFASTLLTPWLLEHVGSRVAFGVPGILMFVATVVFWLGRHRFIHVPPGGFGVVKEAFSGEGFRAVLNLGVIYLFVAVFWSLFDQTASAWVLQSTHMNRETFGWVWLPSQIQAVNPIFILLFIPLFAYVVYPALGRLFSVTPLRKIAIGLFVTAGSFVVSGWIEMQIVAGHAPSILGQFLAYAILTAGEVMVSITCLEFSYTQAPRKMKSFIMALYMLSISLGNFFTARVNQYIDSSDGASGLEGAAYYWFFTGVMLAAAVLFLFVVRFYRGRTYVQDEA